MLDPRKSEIAERIRGALRPLDGLRSVTFVGSFVDREDMSGISDLDTVVVFDRLTPERFQAAVEAVGALTGADLGFPERRVRVNATLGPMKFDGPEQVVVHLMLYDLASHRRHVLTSPFTCLDWERSEESEGATLRELYPARSIQPADFVAARRGLANYLDDLESGTLSYRRLEPSGEGMIEVVDRAPLDRRHAGEYAFHILHNLVANSLKMRTGRSTRWEPADLERAWETQLPELRAWLPFYRELRAIKMARAHEFPADTIERTRAFIQAFSAALDRELSVAPSLCFVRHARTDLNDGTFLGTRRDPGIAMSAEVDPLDGQWDAVYSSPLRRAVDTASRLAPGAEVRIDARLAEIDYGLVEGLTPDQARAKFLELRSAWDDGVDVAFPEGESSMQVLDRLTSFLDSAAGHAGRALVVTHSLVMRVMAAHLLGLDPRKAHRLRVDHLEALELRRIGGRWVPAWSPELNERFLDQFAGWTPA